jgi:hypothetical protein
MYRSIIAGLALVAGALVGCNEPALKQPPADAGPTTSGLTPEQAARVVAKVGDHNITLGDYARTLERMDQFDRLRYQSKERRRELLEEMIDVELLAAEARRLGLDKDPDAQDAVRTILRDAILAQSREGLPGPGNLTDGEIRAYYDAHADKFSEPERRRVQAIVMKDPKEAAKVLKDAQKAKTPAEWGDLYFKHSLTAPRVHGPTNPAELAGDIGVVGPMDDPRGGNKKVPDAVRALAYQLKSIGDVGPDLVEADGKAYIVRLAGMTPAHKRTLAEADRSIRVLLVQEKMAEREKALEDELRQKFTVQIDDKALAGVKVPATEAADPKDKDKDREEEADKAAEQAHDGGK